MMMMMMMMSGRCVWVAGYCRTNLHSSAEYRLGTCFKFEISCMSFCIALWYTVIFCIYGDTNVCTSLNISELPVSLYCSSLLMFNNVHTSSGVEHPELHICDAEWLLMCCSCTCYTCRHKALWVCVCVCVYFRVRRRFKFCKWHIVFLVFWIIY